jgi:hypothetical protein
MTDRLIVRRGYIYKTRRKEKWGEPLVVIASRQSSTVIFE